MFWTSKILPEELNTDVITNICIKRNRETGINIFMIDLKLDRTTVEISEMLVTTAIKNLPKDKYSKIAELNINAAIIYA